MDPRDKPEDDSCCYDKLGWFAVVPDCRRQRKSRINGKGDPTSQDTVTFRRFDAAAYLTDETMIADYLNAAAEENDPALMALALGDVAKAVQGFCLS